MNLVPLITVVIPCYNAEKYIEKAVRSILNQTYTNLEVIILDDASIDNSLPIIEQIKDDRIKLIRLKENTKKIGAVNKAIQLAQGEYIAFQDADDWSHPHRIELQLRLLQNNADCGICFTGYEMYFPCGKQEVDKREIRISALDLRQEFFQFMNASNQHIYKPTLCSTMLVTANLLKETGGYHPYFGGRVAEDVYMVYNILKKTKSRGINKVLYTFTRSHNSLTMNQFTGKNAKASYAWELLKTIIEYDIKEIDLLNDKSHAKLLKEVELASCEKALVDCIHDKNKIETAYKQSSAYKVGHLLLKPMYWLKNKTNLT